MNACASAERYPKWEFEHLLREFLEFLINLAWLFDLELLFFQDFLGLRNQFLLARHCRRIATLRIQLIEHAANLKVFRLDYRFRRDSGRFRCCPLSHQEIQLAEQFLTRH
jgi:hypothetical protein